MAQTTGSAPLPRQEQLRAANTGPPAEDRLRGALPVVLPGAILSALLTAWNYSDQPMWRDEWYTYSAATRSSSELFGLVSNIDGGLAVFYAFMHLWMQFGDSVSWMRIPAGVSTVVIPAIMALVGRRIGGSATGVTSGVLVALLPAVVDHAQEARAYPLVLAAVAATGLAALRHAELPDRKRSIMLALVALVASTLHPIVGAPAVAGIFFGLLATSRPPLRLRIIATGLPAAAAAATLLAIGFKQVDATDVGSSPSLSTLLNLSRIIAPSLVEIYALSALGLLAVVLMIRENIVGSMVLIGWSIAPIATITASAFAGSFYLSRYVSAAALGIGVILAYGIAKVATHATRALHDSCRVGVRGAFAALILLAIVWPLAPGIIEAHIRPYRVDNPQGGSEALSSQWRAGDAAVFVGPVYRGLTNHYLPAGFRVTDPLLQIDPLRDDSFRGQEVEDQNVSSALVDYKRVWLIGLLRDSAPYEDVKKEEASEGRNLLSRQDFGEFSLELWE